MNFSYLALEEVSQNDQGYKVTLTFKRLPHTERIEIVKCLNSDLTDSHKHTLVHQMIQLARAANFTEVLVADIWNPNWWYYDHSSETCSTCDSILFRQRLSKATKMVTFGFGGLSIWRCQHKATTPCTWSHYCLDSHFTWILWTLKIISMMTTPNCLAPLNFY